MALSLCRPAQRGCSRKKQAGYIRGGVFAALFGSPKWTPAKLFANSEQGVWYDPSDFSTMFQDSAGATPVTAVEQPVGKILDKSGRGNHATQATTANRPVLRARYNLLTKTENVADVAWAKQTGVTTPASDTVTTTTADTGVYQAVSLPAGTYKAFVELYKVDVDKIQIGIVNVSDVLQYTFSTNSVAGAAAASAKITNLPDGWVRIEYTYAVAAAGTFGLIVKPSASLIGSLKVRKLDFRTAADAALSIPAYQRVNTSTDYDTAGFPPYLAFNGTNSGLATGNVDFSATDKLVFFCGATKLSDSNVAILCELSADCNSYQGSAYVSAPDGAAAPNFAGISRGTTVLNAGQGSTATGHAAPTSNVLSCTNDISGSNTTLRVNASAAAPGTFQKGTGNFGNYPLYVGSRGGVSLFFNGRLYSLIVRGAASVAAQITNAERAVGSKMGIAL